jgi:patatin-like phospholipase/acyl hydrolase
MAVKNYYRILSLDGGGMRGIFTLKILERLQKLKPDFLSNVDLFAGTSTGGIIALGLADGRRPSQLRKLYRELGPGVFRRWPYFIPGGLSFITLLLKALWDAKYENNRLLKDQLARQFPPQRKLGDLKKNVLVTSFLLDSSYEEPEWHPRAGSYRRRHWKPKFFHNFNVPGSDQDASILDVAMRATGAPVYFPSYGPYVDGGVAANSPSMVALMQALHDSHATPKRRTLISEMLAPRPLSAEQVVLLSISSGHFSQFIEGKDLNWGILQWGRRMVDLLLDSGTSMADWQCRKLLRERYHRLDPDLEEPIPLDVNSPRDFDKLEQKADQAALVDAVNPDVKTQEWLNEYF